MLAKLVVEIALGCTNFYRYVGENEERERGAIEAGFPCHDKVLENNVWSMCVEVANSRLLTKGRSIEE
jgi:hypothetical protein